MSACATTWSSFARTVPSTRTKRYSSATMSDARGSRARFSGFFRPRAVLNMISSPSRTYHMTVRCADPFSFTVPSTANRTSRRKSRSACVRSLRIATASPFLAEQIAIRGTHVLLRGLSRLVGGEATHDRDGAAVELSHDQLCRAGDLVGHSDLRHAQLVSFGIALTHVALERGQTRDPDRDVGVALAPGPPDGVGHDDRDRRAGRSGERVPQALRGRGGIHGQEHDGVGCAGVRAIDARVRADEPVRSEEHTPELQSRVDLVCRLLLETKNEQDES